MKNFLAEFGLHGEWELDRVTWRGLICRNLCKQGQWTLNGDDDVI